MSTLKASYPVDIVITWVNGDDPEWQHERDKYSERPLTEAIRSIDARSVRYRPWETLRYLFRGIDKLAPWARRVYFVTWGHLPPWLNIDNPRLCVVRHDEFIPSEYLPTFSSRTIEFNFHRIKGLSERFVYFNDDMLLLRPTKVDDFFKKGLPCDAAVLSPHKVEYDDWFYAPFTNMAILNKHFRVHESIRKHPFKWLNAKYGVDAVRTVLMLPYPNFFGIFNYHIPSSLMKNTFRELWEAEPKILHQVCSHRFRVATDPNPWLLQEWQIASGRFYPRTVCFGERFHIHNELEAKAAAEFIRKRKRPLVCVNDVIDRPEVTDVCRELVESALHDVFPQPSSFEIREMNR